MSTTPSRSDVLVVGGGIVGLTLARALAARGVGSVTVVEKEPAVGLHASGRNSGVLHSGIYYAADSLKARLCARGARMMREWAAERGVPFEETGKVVVAHSPDAVPALDSLEGRARANGIPVERLGPDELRDVEPEAEHRWGGLHSPTTAVIDSRAVLGALVAELRASGVPVLTGCGLRGVDAARRIADVGGSRVSWGLLVNAAGLHADRIAHLMGVGGRWEILPFKGIYRFLRPPAAARFRGSVYPVPDLRMPFLGVHVTRGVRGEVSVGPTAIPAFGRENYELLRGATLRDGGRMAGLLGRMVALDRQGLRALALSELRNYTPSGLLASARKVAPRLQPEDLGGRTKVGLRAQLVDRTSLSLEMDFVLEEGPGSLHVLNAISPAFTSSFALAELVADRALGQIASPPSSAMET